MKTNLVSACLLTTATCVLAIPVRGQAPDANEILKSALLVTTEQQQDLTGRIRTKDISIPVALYLRGENIQFTYNKPRNQQPVRIHVQHRNGSSLLLKIVNGKTQRFPEARLGEAIEGTDLSGEDLAMSFLHWPNANLEGAEKIKGQDCWMLRITNPEAAGHHRQVRVWIHKKMRAVMQMVGYDQQGRPLKRFQLISLMKVEDAVTIRRLRFDSFDPVSGKILGLTYLEFDRPRANRPGAGRNRWFQRGIAWVNTFLKRLNKQIEEIAAKLSEMRPPE